MWRGVIRRCGWGAAGLVVGAAAMMVFAGPLDPPAGAVSSTHKTLTEVEPRIAINATNTPGDATSQFRISEPGSYYLTADMVGAADKDGIRIESDGVSIDLMGFALSGLEESGAAIVAYEGFGDITVRHGSITAWGGGGVMLASGGRGFVIENLRVSSCGRHGIDAGDAAVVRSCSAVFNSEYGIRVGQSGVVEGCSARSNGGTGIGISIGSVVSASSAGANGGAGIVVESGATARECAAESNQFHGIMASDGSVVSRCSSAFNMFDGVFAGSGSLILENACASNGRSGSGAGVHMVGPYGRIEGNHVINNPRGIDVDAGRNLVVRNYATGNAVNFDIAGSNIVGTIVTTEAQMNAAPNGNVNVSF